MPEPFDDPEWLYDLKWDGFRGVAYIERGACRLVSRNGNTFSRFSDPASVITSKPAIRDHFKTGQRTGTQDMQFLYPAGPRSGKNFLD